MKKKTLLAGILSACIVGTASVLSLTGAAAEKLYGDANVDGTVDMSDCVLIMQALANPSKYGATGSDAKHITSEGIDLADVADRGNGLTANDALSVQRYLLGAISSLPESVQQGGKTTTTTTTTTTTNKESTVTTTTKNDTVVTTTNKNDKTEKEEKDDIKTSIHLNGTSITVDGQYAEANGSKVTISHSGAYTIDGTLTDGQIYVEIPDDKADSGTVKLIFNGVNITGKSAPAILIKNADKTSITIADGTENVISDGTVAYAGDDQTNAVIEAKDDLTIKGGDAGTGTLTITANVQPAIVCNNDIKFTGGITTIETLNENEANDAIKGKTSVLVKGGKLTVKAQGDGIKSSKGNVDIESGEVSIKCGSDAIQAETAINISGGNIAAFGDKGLTSAGTISISGGELLATATDCQCENLTSTEQNTLILDFVKEWSKNNPVTVTDTSNKVLFDMNTLKKYRYAIVSSPELGSENKVFAGGIKMKHSAGSTFKAGKPASFKEVNNDMDNEEQLYSELFSQEMVHKIDVKMDENTWNNLLKNASKEEWTPCDVVIDGEELKNVGIRTKGNSSLMMAQNGKYSFRLKLDKYEKDVNYHGLTEFCMNNMLSDASCMRDILCYNAMYEVGGVAPHAAHTDMYLNGKLYSFYLLAEQPGTTVAERYAVDDDSVLYKATERTGGGGGMGMFGGDGYCSFTENMPLDRFDVKFGTDDNYAHIQDIKTAINKLTPTNYKFIEDVIDVPSFLKGFAVNSIFCNYDSYNGSLAHNYYLMYSGGKAYFVGWDYNLCLGNFTGGADSVTSDITTSLYQANITDRPLAKLLQVPEYYDMYVEIVNDILNYYKDPEAYVSNYAKKIRSHVAADPRGSFTVDDFDKNTTKSAGGLQYNENGGNNGGNNGGWGNWGNFGGQQQGGQQPQQGGQQQGGQQPQWGGQQQGGWGGFQINADEPTDSEPVMTDEQSWAFEGGWGGQQDGGAQQWGGFGGDASFDWGNMDWGNMDFGNMDWGNMDFGGGNGGWGGFGGGGMFGGGQTSVVDFLIKRFEIIRAAINK